MPHCIADFGINYKMFDFLIHFKVFAKHLMITFSVIDLKLKCIMYFMLYFIMYYAAMFIFYLYFLLVAMGLSLVSLAVCVCVCVCGVTFCVFLL
jgi:hypothetical protein